MVTDIFGEEHNFKIPTCGRNTEQSVMLELCVVRIVSELSLPLVVVDILIFHSTLSPSHLSGTCRLPRTG